MGSRADSSGAGRLMREGVGQVDKAECRLPLGNKAKSWNFLKRTPVLGTGSNHRPWCRRTDFRVQAKVSLSVKS